MRVSLFNLNQCIYRLIILYRVRIFQDKKIEPLEFRILGLAHFSIVNYHLLPGPCQECCCIDLKWWIIGITCATRLFRSSGKKHLNIVHLLA